MKSRRTEFSERSLINYVINFNTSMDSKLILSKIKSKKRKELLRSSTLRFGSSKNSISKKKTETVTRKKKN